MRKAYLKQQDECIQLGKKGVIVSGYGSNRRIVCRLEINAGGMAIYRPYARRYLANLTWEELVAKFL